jgi:hypothetical protein
MSMAPNEVANTVTGQINKTTKDENSFDQSHLSKKVCDSAKTTVLLVSTVRLKCLIEML